MALDETHRAQLAWLTAEDDDAGIAVPREQLGRNLLDLDASWYREEPNLEALIDFARTHGSGALLAELEQAADPAARLAWLAQLVRITRYTAPAFDADYGLYYRYDKQTGGYEWAEAPDTPPDGWMSQSAADARVALRRQNTETSGPQPHDGTAAGPSTHAEVVDWAWDENWAMFYRIGSTGVYEYAHSADDAHTRPAGPWLSGEQVLHQREASTQTAGDAAVPGQSPRDVILALVPDITRAVPDFDEFTDEEIAQAVEEFLNPSGA